jgi:biotin transport system substrate-specific component
MPQRRINLPKIVSIALMAAIMCVIGPLSVPLPFTGVPVSFTNMIICLSVYLLGIQGGTLSCVIYLLLGFAGLPVFSGFTGGVGKLAGPTGGYLIGFIFLALICGIFAEKHGAKSSADIKQGFSSLRGKRWFYALGMALGMGVAYVFGTAWLAYQANLGFSQAIFAGVIPFLPGDALKIVLITVVAPEIKKRISHIYV